MIATSEGDDDCALQGVINDCLRRRLAGEDISDESVISKYPELMPELAEELRKLRLVAAAMEQALNDTGPGLVTIGQNAFDTLHGRGQLEVRCPTCHQPKKVAADTALTDIVCSACGSHFNLVGQTDASRVAPSLTKLGRFELIERLGVGGFGSVWKARDKELDRFVAVKIPRVQAITPEDQEKFFREARAAAQLRHPSIVSVHEVGRDDDSIYIVSDFVRGVTLNDWQTGQQPTSREAVELCIKIADALQHAHEQGVVHRDLKPANIIIDRDVRPHLTDFGLARRDVGEVTVTIDGQVLGTPAYMPPEQAQGEAHTADRRSDIYSLGVILFQLITGELPFRGNARMMMHQVIHEEPPSPRKFNATIPRDLETITLKCLSKDPDSRYQSAYDLAADLRRFLVGEPIRARPTGVLERAARWVRRNKTVAALSSTVALVLVVGTILSTYLAVINRQQAIVARASERESLFARQGAEAARTAAIERQNDAEAAEAKEAQARKDAEAISNFLISAFQIPDPELDGRTITVAEILKRAEGRLEKELPNQSLTQAAVLIAIGESRLGLGLPREAIKALTHAVELRSQALGPDHPETLAAFNTLAYAYQEAGMVQGAVPFFERVWVAKQKKPGRLDPLTLVAENNLAYAYQKADQIEKAVPLFEETLAGRKKALGVDDVETLASMNNLAYAYQCAGRFDDAIPLFEQTLAARKLVLSSGHPNSLASINNLAYAYQEAGRLNDAISTFQQSLEARRKYLGPNHPDTYETMNDLAYAYQSAGRLSDAIPLFEQALTGRRNTLGLDHSLTLASRNNLAYAYQENDQLNEAIPLFEQNLAARKARFSADNPDTLASMNNLAYAYQVANRMDDAIPLFRQALAGRRANLGADHPDTLISMKNLARALAFAHEADEARQINREMIDHGMFFESRLVAAALGSDAVDEIILAARAYHEEKSLQSLDALALGELRLVGGELASAEKLLSGVIERDTNKQPIYNSLAWCLFSEGKNEEARRTFQLTLRDCKRDDETYNLETADADHWTAGYFLDAVTESAYVDHFRADKNLASLPWFYIAQRREINKDTDQAIQAYQQCVDSGVGEASQPFRAFAEWKLSKLKGAAAK